MPRGPRGRSDHRHDLAPQDIWARPTNRACPPSRRPTPAGSTTGAGLAGRELNVLTCNDHNDGIAAAKCARRAVKENAVAVVGSYSQHADSFFPVLEGAGIPYIGGYGITNTEFTSPLSYPVNGGQPALLAGLGSTLADSCGPVTLVRPDTIAGDQLPVLLDLGTDRGRARAGPRPAGGGGRHRVRRAVRAGAGAHDHRPGRTGVRGARPRGPHRHLHGLLPAGSARSTPRWVPRACSAASTRP